MSKSFSLIAGDLDDIMTNGETTRANVNMELIIHTPDEDIEVTNFNSVDIIRDYMSNKTDHVVVNAFIELSTLINSLLPNRDNLDCSLTLGMMSPSGKMEGGVTRYKAFLTGNYNDVYNSALTQISEEDLDRAAMYELKLQLIDKEFITLKSLPLTDNITYVGNNKLEEFIATKLYETIGKFKVKSGGKDMEIDLSIIPPHNKGAKSYSEYMKTIPNPHNLSPLDFPYFLQVIEGVYNGGIGTYLQRVKDKMTMFVYPLFDANSYKRNDASTNAGYDYKEKLMAFSYGKKSGYESNDIGFWNDGNILKIPVGGEISARDTGLDKTREEGNIVFAQFAKDTMSTTNPLYPDNKSCMTLSFGDGFQKIDFGTFEENQYVQITEKLASMFTPIEVSWENGNPNYIFPGMPVQLVYEANNYIYLFEGTVAYIMTTIERTYQRVRSKMLLNVLLKDKRDLSKNY